MRYLLSHFMEPDQLDITFLDATLRLSRGDMGNLFVLAMDDPKDRP